MERLLVICMFEILRNSYVVESFLPWNNHDFVVFRRQIERGVGSVLFISFVVVVSGMQNIWVFQ